jgi:hypothetical protein
LLSPVIPASLELGRPLKAASPPPTGDQQFDDEDLPYLAETSASEDEPLVHRRRIQSFKIQCKLHKWNSTGALAGELPILMMRSHR